MIWKIGEYNEEDQKVGCLIFELHSINITVFLLFTPPAETRYLQGTGFKILFLQNRRR